MQSTRLSSPNTPCPGPGDGDVIRRALSRRDFVHAGIGSALGAVMANWIARDSAVAAEGAKGRAQSCVLLWMNGGPSHLDTWDPKPGHKNGGPFRAIDTRVPGIKISEHLAQCAEVADRLAIVRGLTSTEGNHERAQYLMHTGYAPNPTVVHPSIGALVGVEKGDPKFDLPNFVSIGAGSAGAGFLGVGNGPFVVPNPLQPIANLSYPTGVDRARFMRRLRLMNYFETQLGKATGDRKVPDRDAVYWKAIRMMHSELRAGFELEDEPAAVRESYGQNAFGQGCLMARRLIERGVKFVEVRLGGWDTHNDNFTRLESLVGETLDPAMSSLIKDLDQRNLLDSTMVIWMGDFGRTPRINQTDGRDHYPRAFSAVLAGGGIRGGQVVGATSDDGTTVVKDEVKAPDLFATIAHACGMPIDKVNYTPKGRPIRLTPKGAKVVQQLLA